ncbi:1-acyl-sn-glycerol-3-phosphate acyltransferase [Neisseriaceae bacterium TC5R-5]|nr:1-acyl-sn-glycerol-3-phosphate acyltransferase [Neisseriaceae bacterium TC5R-5]
MGISLNISGVNPGFYPPNTLLVANHVSWLDIFVLNSCTVSRFVAKSEIRAWPLFGWLIHISGAVFIDRGRRSDAAKVNKTLAKAMKDGACMAVFPEATTSDGSGVLPFKASLFEAPLLSCGVVQPVALRYLGVDGALTREPAYIGDVTFWQSIRKVLAVPSMKVEVHYGQALRAWEDGLETRFVLAKQAYRDIAKALNVPIEIDEGAVSISSPVGQVNP